MRKFFKKGDRIVVCISPEKDQLGFDGRVGEVIRDGMDKIGRYTVRFEPSRQTVFEEGRLEGLVRCFKAEELKLIN